MSKLLLILFLLMPGVAFGQCTGVFSDGQVCGNATGATSTPRATTITNMMQKFTPPLLLTVPAGTTTGGLQVVSNGAGSTAPNQMYYNYMTINTDVIDAGSSPATSYVIGHFVNHAFGGSAAKGGRFASFDALTQLDATAATNAVRFYVASGGQAQSNVSDGGTIGGGNEKGRLYGGSHNAALAGTATGYEQVSARYDYITMTAGTSAKTKMIQQYIYEAQDVVQGSTYDAAVGISAEAGASAGGKYGFLIGNFAGAHPLAATATIFGTTGAGTVTNGIDLSGYTFTSTAFKSNNFTVDGAGNVGAAAITTTAILSTVPTTLSGTSGTVNALSQIINPSGGFTLTLLNPTTNAGRWQYVKTIAAQTVSSASANVVPLAGGGAGTPILAATAGKWAWLQSDGTNWIIMAGN